MTMIPPATAMAAEMSTRWDSLCDFILTAIPANANEDSLPVPGQYIHLGAEVLRSDGHPCGGSSANQSQAFSGGI